jgi:hypothetical protein
MNRKQNIIYSILLTALFVMCLFLPVIQFLFEKQLSGAEAFLLNVSRLFLVQDYFEYLQVMVTVLTNFFVLTLVIWSYRVRIKLIPTLFISAFSLSSALFWVYKYYEKGILLYGYWVWIIFIIVLIVFNLVKYKNQRIEG